MSQSRYYSSTAGKMTLQAAITSGSTSLVVDTTTGLPASTPFPIIIDPGLSTEEICDVTAVGGTTLTIARGVDGTSAQAHGNGAEIRHGFSARDFNDSRTHEAATTNVHGVTGALVGTTNTQALSNKDLTSSTNTFPSTLATLAGAQVLTNKDLTSGTNTFPSSLVTLTGTQALTNKDLSGLGNVFPTSLATLTGTQTLTGKTMDGGSNTFTNLPRSSVASATAYTDTAQTWTATQTFSSGNPVANFSQSPVYAKGTTATGFTNTTVTQLNAPAITANGSQTFKITATWFGVISTVAGDFIDMAVYSNGSQVDAVRCYVASSSTHSSGGTCVGYDTPAAGSVTYSLRSARAFGSGNCGIYVSASTPMVIIVEQIG